MIDRPGPVIWLMGLSGSGKTTLGRKLVAHYRAEGRRAEMIDGDATRDFFEDRADYSRENRIANIKRVAFAAMLLSRQGVAVVISNISPFEEARRFVRAKVPGYREIYLKASAGECAQRDAKGLYGGARNGQLTQVVGVDIPFEPLASPDLVLETGSEPQERSFEKLLTFLKNRGSL